MSHVVTFTDYTPGARADGLPWTHVRFDEAPAATGPWATIDTQALDPVDADPAAPATRALLTTEQATLPVGWYRLVWVDANGDIQVTDPVSNRPSPLSIATLKRYLGKQLSGDDVLLEQILDAAVALAATYTGRQLAAVPANDGDDPVTVTVRPAGSRYIRVPDAREITELLVDGTATTDYTPVGPLDAATVTKIRLLRRGARLVEITGRFGLDPFPADLADAIYVLAARNFHEKDAGYADAVAPGEGAAAAQYFRMMPARVRAVFDSYRVASDHYGLA